MQPTVSTFTLEHDLTILGLATRTGLASAAQDIPALWQRFFAEGVAAKLPAVDGTIYALYCDYESDFRGGYTMVLGVACPADAEVPAGLRRVRVPSGRFAALPVRGNPAEVVWRGWSFVNGEWEGKQQRRYVADFERYTRVGMEEIEAELCVGLLA